MGVFFKDMQLLPKCFVFTEINRKTCNFVQNIFVVVKDKTLIELYLNNIVVNPVY